MLVAPTRSADQRTLSELADVLDVGLARQQELNGLLVPASGSNHEGHASEWVLLVHIRAAIQAELELVGAALVRGRVDFSCFVLRITSR